MFSAAMESVLTPRTQKWHTLSTSVAWINAMPEVEAYLQQVTDILFEVRYNPKGNFANQTNEVYRNLGKYGTACLFVDDDIGKHIRYKSIHLSELFIAENAAGHVDTVYRKFQYTAHQAATAWGEDALPDLLKEQLKNNPDEKYWFIHAVEPNDDYIPGLFNHKGMKWSSVYICADTKDIVSEGGYRTMPYAVSRYYTNTNEIYGRSPIMDVLPDIKTLNKIERTNLRAEEMITNPPVLLPADGALKAFNLKPGGLNYGGVSPDGKQMAIPFQTGANTEVSNKRADQKRDVINNAMKIKLFQILVETPEMTATEAMYRQQEKGALLAPIMGRQQCELLGPIIERELDILSHSGILPPMPPVIKQLLGGNVDISYESPLAKAQRADEGIGIMNTLQALGTIAQYDPSVVQMIDYQAVARELVNINGAPVSILKTPEQIAAEKQQQAQQAQLNNILQAAPVAAQTAQTLQQMQQAASQPSPAISNQTTTGMPQR
jgi:hypothetical protein